MSKFCNWLHHFDNWFALQNAILAQPLNAQQLSAEVKCWSLIQHLGIKGRDRLATVFTGKVPIELDEEYGILRAILSAIFVEVPSLRIARHQFFMQKQKANEVVMDFASILQTLTKDCNFGVMEDDLLTSQLCTGRYYQRVKLELLPQKTLDFESAVKLAISVESVSCIGNRSVCLPIYIV